MLQECSRRSSRFALMRNASRELQKIWQAMRYIAARSGHLSARRSPARSLGGLFLTAGRVAPWISRREQPFVQCVCRRYAVAMSDPETAEQVTRRLGKAAPVRKVWMLRSTARSGKRAVRPARRRAKPSMRGLRRRYSGAYGKVLPMQNVLAKQ